MGFHGYSPVAEQGFLLAFIKMERILNFAINNPLSSFQISQSLTVYEIFFSHCYFSYSVFSLCFFLLKAGHDFFYFQIGSAVAVLDVETQK